MKRPSDENPANTLTRRALVGSSLALLAGCSMPGMRDHGEFTMHVQAIQDRIGGRIGVSTRDTLTDRHLQFHGEDRFAMCSTFKLLLAAHVLTQVDRGTLQLDQQLVYDTRDLLPNSPVSLQHVQEGSLNIRELAAAIVTVSDNTAANLLLRQTGGPAGLTAFLRSLGDTTTRLDREELTLNTNLPNDPRDTTTPAAMTASLARLFTGNALTTAARTQLVAWAGQSQTGLRRLRAGIPSAWAAGDKTGTGANGAVNDLLVAWPTERHYANGHCVVAAVYMSESRATLPELEAAHAQIGRLIAQAIA